MIASKTWRNGLSDGWRQAFSRKGWSDIVSAANVGDPGDRTMLVAHCRKWSIECGLEPYKPLGGVCSVAYAFGAKRR